MTSIHGYLDGEPVESGTEHSAAVICQIYALAGVTTGCELLCLPTFRR